jgi:predicted enzyme related to lactoylglutathione lyase
MAESEACEYKIGNFVWNEAGVRDAEAAKKFYTELLGWTPQDMDMGPQGTYTLLQVDGKNVAGLYELKGEQFANVPPHWMPYVAVDDCDERTHRAQALGGRMMMPPMDVPNVGRMSIVSDPLGATLSLFQRSERASADKEVPTGPGTFCWNELMTTNIRQAAEYYGRLLHWEPNRQQVGDTPYTVWLNGDQMAGGMMEITEQMGDIQPHWMSYVSVKDCDATVKKAARLGANILHGPMDIPTVGRMATIQDPQGAVFSVITMAEQAGEKAKPKQKTKPKK